MFFLTFLGVLIISTASAKPQQSPNPANPTKCLPVALTQITAAVKSCTESNKFNFPTFNNVSDTPKIIADFEKTFNDNCFSKCIGDQLKLITPDNKLNRVEFTKVIKISNASDEFTKNLEKIWMTCADTVEGKMKTEKDNCKLAAMFATCNVKALYDQRDTMPKC